jgi:hypothetical protein
MKPFLYPVSLSLTILLSFAPAAAASEASSIRPIAVPVWMEAAMSSGVFQEYHPDIRWQQRGIRHYRAGRLSAAERAFREGASYGDKGSQAMLAQIHWRGESVPVDKAKAYAWMDLAAERGYPIFLVEREKMWQQLDHADRNRLSWVGPDLHGQYADEFAKPRLERKLRAGRFRTLTGSRAGYDAGVKLATQRTDGSYDFDTAGSKGSGGASGIAHYQQDRYWNPRRYWLAQDRIWKGLPTGEVIVHPLRDDADGS